MDNMRWLILLAAILLSSGCTKDYYRSIQEINAAIAESNARQAEICANAIISAKGNPTAIVALALAPVCQDKQEAIVPAEPEKVSEVVKQILFASVPWAFVEMGRAARGPTSYDVGGDYVNSNGPGSAGTSRTYPTEVIIMGEEN
jgi:hypothetical protein